MSTDEFDDLDRALTSGLSALAPEVEGADETLASLRPRFRRARRRARVAKAGGVIAALLVVGSVATLAAPSSQRTNVRVSSPPTTRERARHRPAVSTSTSTVRSTTTTTAAPVGSPTPTSTPASGPTDPAHGFSPRPPTPTTAPGTTPGTNQPGDGGGSGAGNGGSHGGQGGDGGSTGTTVPNSDNGVRTYRSDGGSIRVRFTDGNLSLVSTAPASGFQPDVRKNESQEVEVRFQSDHTEWRILVQVDNGHPTVRIDES